MILSLLVQTGRAILKGIAYLADKFDYTKPEEHARLQFFKVEDTYYYAAYSEFDVKIAFCKEMGRAYSFMTTIHPWEIITCKTTGRVFNVEFMARMQMKLEPQREDSLGFRIKMLEEYGFQNLNY